MSIAMREEGVKITPNFAYVVCALSRRLDYSKLFECSIVVTTDGVVTSIGKNV